MITQMRSINKKTRYYINISDTANNLNYLSKEFHLLH